MKPLSTREIQIRLDQAFAQKKKGEIFRVHSKRERNDVLAICRYSGHVVLTNKVDDDVFQIVIP